MEKKPPSRIEEKLRLKITETEEVIDNRRIKHALKGQIDTPMGPISILDTSLKAKDHLYNIGVRLGLGRDDYKVPTCLYAIGNPTDESPVLVTANYKLTVDKLRIELDGLSLWILVIDTKGVNVWCAAGKGTFSTEEIIYRIKKLKLKELVTHNNLILPQLGAPGVSAYEITRFTGFKVLYGPVYAKDIKKYLEKSCQATQEMRRVDFNLSERIAVSPLEAIMSMKYLPFIFIFFLILQVIGGENLQLLKVLEGALMNTLPYLMAVIIGTILFPILLPILPFRMFSLKGAVLGILWSLFVVKYSSVFYFSNNLQAHIANTLLLTSIISFLGLNFTGSTTFTSLSGVRKEIIRAVPVMAGATVLATVLMVVERLR